MNLVRLILVLFVSVSLRALADNGEPLIGQQISLTTEAGKLWEGKIISVAPDGITILTSDGGGKLLYLDMKQEDRAKYGFDQAKFEAFDLAQLAAEESRKEASYAAAHQPQWRAVANFSGDASKTTEPFTISSDRWRVKWQLDASQEAAELMKGSGQSAGKYASIWVRAVKDGESDTDSQDVVSKMGPGSDQTEMNGAGTWRLKVNDANAQWKIVVEEYR